MDFISLIPNKIITTTVATPDLASIHYCNNGTCCIPKPATPVVHPSLHPSTLQWPRYSLWLLHACTYLEDYFKTGLYKSCLQCPKVRFHWLLNPRSRQFIFEEGESTLRIVHCHASADNTNKFLFPLSVL